MEKRNVEFRSLDGVILIEEPYEGKLHVRFCEGSQS